MYHQGPTGRPLQRMRRAVLRFSACCALLTGWLFASGASGVLTLQRCTHLMMLSRQDRVPLHPGLRCKGHRIAAAVWRAHVRQPTHAHVRFPAKLLLRTTSRTTRCRHKCNRAGRFCLMGGVCICFPHKLIFLLPLFNSARRVRVERCVQCSKLAGCRRCCCRGRADEH